VNTDLGPFWRSLRCVATNSSLSGVDCNEQKNNFTQGPAIRIDRDARGIGTLASKLRSSAGQLHALFYGLARVIHSRPARTSWPSSPQSPTRRRSCTTTPPTALRTHSTPSPPSSTGTDRAHHHPDLASRLAVLLADVQLRDVAILISLDHAEAAAALWTQLANQLTGAARLGMLTIAAGAYYAAYDTVRAGIALDIAADEAAAQQLEFPRLASMLLSALNIGMPPEKVRVALGAAGRRDT